MKRWVAYFLLTLACLPTLSPTFAQAKQRLVLATTTSTQNSGLLEVLLPPFEQKNNARVAVIAVGTGQALRLGEAGDADVLMVHARAREEAFVAAGYGLKRHELMYNDFVILGPPTDPAGVRGMKDATAALARIAASGARFISRADQSGTHVMEMDLWQQAGVKPKGRWYIEAGRGMGEVIHMATELSAYALADRGTYLAYLGKTDLVVACEGDARLFNPYGVIAVNPARHPHVKIELAEKFIAYLFSDEAQSLIKGLERNQQQLFFTYP
ncbi:tungstate transport system substrate-binding protein [Geoalkalibacter ferrihydriticus]|uniref:Tungsten ABC transporter substrate-binding protein n=2 Tax=Geoalkalibacter ferrihydriticus TaxID=392333 RepID=A0A0C2HYB3_9BACT|nr:substrate-binding domain-containing protein [Geoalkalibacter ferrihydriticus]KIH77737.1 tungsten ABC transporter substrate-binding protein [Geoalkalibacter ferrihydriticus DSM 17813]SDL76438.1 tungstate transport system substrate-binding protein [Geoalkalibacter ferrihydriticus]